MAYDDPALKYALELLGTDAEVHAGTAMLAAKYVELHGLVVPEYSERKGPKTEVRFSCFGCEYHRHKDGHGGRKYLCAQPSIVEKFGSPQYTCTSNAMAPEGLCPYLGGT